MKIYAFVLFVLLIFSGCSSLSSNPSSSDINNCVTVSSPAPQDVEKSQDKLLVECLDKKRSKRDSERGFWDRTLEEFAFTLLDIVFS